MSPKMTNLIHSMCHQLDDVMRLCCELSTNQQIQTTVKGSGKGAAAAGGLAFAGGLVGGPLGIAVGQWKNATEKCVSSFVTMCQTFTEANALLHTIVVYRTGQYC